MKQKRETNVNLIQAHIPPQLYSPNLQHLRYSFLIPVDKGKLLNSTWRAPHDISDQGTHDRIEFCSFVPLLLSPTSLGKQRRKKKVPQILECDFQKHLACAQLTEVSD